MSQGAQLRARRTAQPFHQNPTLSQKTREGCGTHTDLPSLELPGTIHETPHARHQSRREDTHDSIPKTEALTSSVARNRSRP